jgi:DNA replication protein DnaC
MAEKRAQEENQKRELLRRMAVKSGMGDRFLRRTFANFEMDTAERKKNAAAAKKYAANFRQHLPGTEAVTEANGLLITGTKGTGKTHIAAAIANYLLGQGIEVICLTERDLFSQIQKTYSWSSANGISEFEVMETYKIVPLLIIDDLGKERPTPWTLATLYSIVDGRYYRAMPLVVTTNYDAQMLIDRLIPKDRKIEGDEITADAIVDRLTEMCKCIVMTGESWRSR